MAVMPPAVTMMMAMAMITITVTVVMSHDTRIDRVGSFPNRGYRRGENA